MWVFLISIPSWINRLNLKFTFHTEILRFTYKWDSLYRYDSLYRFNTLRCHLAMGNQLSAGCLRFEPSSRGPKMDCLAPLDPYGLD